MAILAGITPSDSIKVRHSPLASENLGKSSESVQCAMLKAMRRHVPVIAHCTDSEDFPKLDE